MKHHVLKKLLGLALALALGVVLATSMASQGDEGPWPYRFRPGPTFPPP